MNHENRFTSEVNESQPKQNTSFNRETGAPSSSTFRNTENSNSIFKLSGTWSSAVASPEQAAFVEKMKANLKNNVSSGETVLNKHINENNVLSEAFYVETQTKISVIILIFEEGSTVTMNSRSPNEGEILIPLRHSPNIKSNFTNLFNKTNKIIDFVSTIVVRSRDLTNIDYSALVMSRKIEMLLRSSYLDLAGIININSFMNNSIKVADTNVQVVREFFRKQNPLAVQPEIDMGIILSFVNNKTGETLPRFIAMGASVNMLPLADNGRDSLLLKPMITVTALDSENFTINRGLFPIAATIAYSIFSEQGMWKEVFSPENIDRRYLNELIQLSPEEGDTEAPYTNQRDYETFLRTYCDKPGFAIEINSGTMLPYAYTEFLKLDKNKEFSAQNVLIDGITEFFKPRLSPMSETDTVPTNIQTALNALMSNNWLKNASMTFTGWYDDPIKGQDISLDRVNYVNWKLSVDKNNVLNTRDEEAITEALIEYSSGSNPVKLAILKNLALTDICRTPTQATFAYVKNVIFLGSRFFSVMSQLCRLTGLTYINNSFNGKSYRLVSDIDSNFWNDGVFNDISSNNNQSYGRGNVTNNPFDNLF